MNQFDSASQSVTASCPTMVINSKLSQTVKVFLFDRGGDVSFSQFVCLMDWASLCYDGIK